MHCYTIETFRPSVNAGTRHNLPATTIPVHGQGLTFCLANCPNVIRSSASYVIQVAIEAISTARLRNIHITPLLPIPVQGNWLIAINLLNTTH